MTLVKSEQIVDQVDHCVRLLATGRPLVAAALAKSWGCSVATAQKRCNTARAQWRGMQGDLVEWAKDMRLEAYERHRRLSLQAESEGDIKTASAIQSAADRLLDVFTPTKVELSGPGGLPLALGPRLTADVAAMGSDPEAASRVALYAATGAEDPESQLDALMGHVVTVAPTAPREALMRADATWNGVRRDCGLVEVVEVPGD